jgi:hypothetical protein
MQAAREGVTSARTTSTVMLPALRPAGSASGSMTYCTTRCSLGVPSSWREGMYRTLWAQLHHLLQMAQTFPRERLERPRKPLSSPSSGKDLARPLADRRPDLFLEGPAAGLEQAQDSGHPGTGPRRDAVSLHRGQDTQMCALMITEHTFSSLLNTHSQHN